MASRWRSGRSRAGLGAAVCRLRRAVEDVAVAFVPGKLQMGRPPLVERGVDDRTPDPGFERPVAAECVTLPHGGRERLLYRVPRSLGVPDDGGGDPAVLVAASCGRRARSRRATACRAGLDDPHASMTLRGARFLYRRRRSSAPHRRHRLPVEPVDVVEQARDAVALEHALAPGRAHARAELGVARRARRGAPRARPCHRASTTKPSTPSRTTSGTPPTPYATTGLPAASASITVTGVPSFPDGSAIASIAAYHGATSSW